MVDLGSAHGLIQIDYQGDGVKQAKADLGSLQTAGKDVGASIKTAAAPLIGLGAAAGGALGLASKSAIDFQKSMGNVNSILQGSDEELAALGDSVMNLSGEVAQAPVELADALYDISSSGFTGADGLKVLDASARAANAGMTDTATAAQGVSAVLNAYGMSADDAAHVSDVMFQTVNEGVISFDQLAKNMGNTLPAANTLGVSFEELGAAYAQMTLQGVGASQAETQIASLMKSALNPTDDLTAAIQGYGYESAQALIDAEGMPGLLKAIEQGAGGNSAALFDMLGTQEAVNAAMVLGKDHASAYEESLGRMEHSSDGVGATNTALAEQMDTAAFAIDRAKAAFKTFLTTLGQSSLGPIQAIATGIGDLLFALSDLPAGAQAAIASVLALTAGLGGLAGAALLIVPKLVEFKKALDVIKAGKAAGDFAALGAAMGPIAAIAAVAAIGILAYKTNFLGFGDAVRAVGGAIKQGMADFGRMQKAAAAGSAKFTDLGKQIDGVGRAIEEMTGIPVSGLFSGIADGVDGIAREMDNFRQGFLTSWTQSLSEGIGVVPALLGGIADGIRGLGGDNTPGVLVAIADGIDALAGAASAAGDGIAEFAGEVRANVEAGLSPINAIVNELTDRFPALGGVFQAVGAQFQNFFDTIGNIGGALRDMLGALTDLDFGTALQKGFDAIGSAVSGSITNIKLLGESFGAAFDALRGMDWGGIAQGISEGLGNALQGLSTFGQEMLQKAADAIAGVDWGSIWNNVTATAQGLVDKLGDLAGAIGTWISGAASQVPGLIANLWSGVQEVAGTIVAKFGDLAGAIGTWLTNAAGSINWAQIADNAQDIAGTIVGKLGDLAGAVGTWISNATGSINWAQIADNVTDIAGTVVAKLGNLAGALGTWISNAASNLGWTQIADNVTDIAGTVVGKLGNLAGELATWVSNATANFDLGTAIEGKVSPIAQNVVGKLGDLGSCLKAWVESAVPQGVLDTLTAAITTFQNVATNAYNAVARLSWGNIFASLGAAKDAVFAAVEGAVKTFQSTVSGAYNALHALDWSGVFGTLGAVKDSVFAAVEAAIRTFQSAVSGAYNALHALDWSGVFSTLLSVKDTVFTAVEAAARTMQAAISGVYNALHSISWSEVFGTLKATVEDVWNAVAEAASKMATAVSDALTKIQGVDFAGIMSTIGGAVQGAADAFGSLAEKAAGALSALDAWGQDQINKVRGVFGWEPAGAGGEGENAPKTNIDLSNSVLVIDPAIGQTIVNQIAAAVAGADWSQVSTTIAQFLNAAVSAGLGGGANSMGGPGERGEAGTASAGIGSGIVSQIAASISSADAGPITTAINGLLTKALGGGGGGEGGEAGGAQAAGQKIMTDIAAGIGRGTETATTAMTAAMSAIQNAIIPAMTTMVTIVQSQTTVMVTSFTTFGTNAAAAVQSGMSLITTAVESGMTGAANAVTTQTGLMTQSFTTFGTNAAAAVASAMQQITTAVESGMTAAANIVSTQVATIQSTLAGAAQGAYDAGVAIGQGFANGISSMTSAVAEAAGGLVNAAAGAIATLGLISSPSRLTMELGEFFGQGFALGIEGMGGDAAAAGGSLVRGAVGGLMQQLQDGSFGGRQAADNVRQGAQEFASDLGERVINVSVESVLDGGEFNRQVIGRSLKPVQVAFERLGKKRDRY